MAGEDEAGAVGVLPGIGVLVAGRYRLLAVLDSGGMGCVFRAQDERLGRHCALKFMRPELARQSELRARFEREARSAGKLQLEHVVNVTDFGVHADSGAEPALRGGPAAALPFIAMELLEGEDLKRLLQREQRLPLPRALELTLQACRGLQAVHAHGMVHRDVKPGNLFVTRHADGRDLVKLLDFGVAKGGGDQSAGTATQAGAMVGTLAYMPPEQVRGEAIDVRTDVYALGAVLYEALCGRPPFAAPEPHVLIHRILNEAPPNLHELRPGLPEDVYRLVAHALARDPAQRPASAEALARLIERAANPADPSAVTSAGTGGSAVVRSASGVPDVRRRSRWWLAALVASAVLTLASWWLWQSRALAPGIGTGTGTGIRNRNSEPEFGTGTGSVSESVSESVSVSGSDSGSGSVSDSGSGSGSVSDSKPAPAKKHPKPSLDIGEVFTH